MTTILSILVAAYMGYSADDSFRNNKPVWGAVFLVLSVINLANACIGMVALNG